MAERKIRLHTLAKELGVASKAIIEKCRAEDIDVKNHMHVLTKGLAATIRKWFSEGAQTTTMEEPARVDLSHGLGCRYGVGILCRTRNRAVTRCEDSQ